MLDKSKKSPTAPALRSALGLCFFAAMLGLGSASAAEPEQASAAPVEPLFEPLIPEPSADGYVYLEWDSLMPASYTGESSAESDGLAVVEELIGMKVSIPGFMVPLDVDGTGLLVNKFLLVPYHGACVHVPPPPPNQLIYSELDTPYALDEMWVPLEIFGTLQAEYLETEIAAVGYRMDVDKIILFEYQ